jgi:hypothetical protein
MLHARHHRAPAAADARQAAFAHAVQQRVLRVHVDEGFGDVAGQRGGLAGARHGVPLVAHAAGVEDQRVISQAAWGARRGRHARAAIGVGETMSSSTRAVPAMLPSAGAAPATGSAPSS